MKSSVIGKLQDEKPLCNRVPVPMNFSKESVKDLPSKGFDAKIPTFWLLEGVVMYLSKEV